MTSGSPDLIQIYELHAIDFALLFVEGELLDGLPFG